MRGGRRKEEGGVQRRQRAGNRRDKTEIGALAILRNKLKNPGNGAKGLFGSQGGREEEVEAGNREDNVR